MPQRLRKPRLPRFGEPPAGPPRAVHVRATSVHGIPIDLRLSAAAEVLSHPSSFSQAKTVNTRGSFASFVRALHAPSDGLTVEVEAFCAPSVAGPPAPPVTLPMPKVSTPNPLPDGAVNALVPTKQPLLVQPAPPQAVTPPAPGTIAGPPPTLEELAALAEIRDSAGAPPMGAPVEAPFPPPPAPTANTPQQAPKALVQPQAASVGHGHDVFDRMAPPMAMTFDVGNVSLQRQFDAMDARLDREATPRPRNGRARAASVDDMSLAHDLAGMRWALAAHAGHVHDEAPDPISAKAAPTRAPEPVPTMTPPAVLPETPAISTTGVRMIDAAALIAGDIVVITDARVSMMSTPLPGEAPATRTLFALGNSLVAEPAGAGVVVRSIGDAVATANTALAFRATAPGPTIPGVAFAPSNLLAYLGHLKATSPR